MRVSRLALTDFRSYENLSLDFPSGTVTLAGPNGVGKTNIVEAIRFLSTLSSHRVSTDTPLVRVGAGRAIVGATMEKAGRSLAVEVTIQATGANSARLNSAAARPRDIAGILRTVVFSPDDLDLIKGEPSGRRRFLDEVAVALEPKLAGDIADYDRVVRQRSTLLKTARGRPGGLETLDVWDEKLAHLGAKVVRARVDATLLLRPHVSVAYADIAPDGGVCALTYASSSAEAGAFDQASVSEIEEVLVAALARERTKEVERGVCLVGPHRDDLEVNIGALPARGFASHGESWSGALALRLGTYAMMTAAGGPDSGRDGEPVLILDDVFAELDSSRRSALAERLVGAHQVIVTAAVVADVPVTLGGNVLMVGNGTVTPVA